MIEAHERVNQFGVRLYWRVRDIREEITRRFGWDCTPRRYRYLQQLGIVPEPEPGWKDRYEARLSLDEVEMIMARIAQQIKPPRNGKIRWRRPGLWRRSEVMDEIKRRTGITIDRGRWDYIKSLGLVPYPEGELPETWTDGQVEEIIATIETHATVEEPTSQ